MNFWSAIFYVLIPFAVITFSSAQGDEKTLDQLTWADASSLTLHGQGWHEKETPYNRFPQRAKENVRPPVWILSRDTAGMYVDFETTTTQLAVRWDLLKGGISFPHMPATGVSGFDLYAWDSAQKKWRWLAISGKSIKQKENENVMVKSLPKESRLYRLYFPLYNGVTSISIGSEGEIVDSPRNETAAKPLIFYGTSITQGASANRPGMAYPAQVGRDLAYDTINLGFSGNALIEPEVANLLAELEATAFILDPLPNNSGPTIAARLEKFIAILREKHPKTPILLVECIVYTDAFLLKSREERANNSNAQVREVWKKLAQSDPNIFLLGTDKLLGGDGEDTVDGTHPTDLGMYRIATGISEKLREILSR